MEANTKFDRILKMIQDGASNDEIRDQVDGRMSDKTLNQIRNNPLVGGGPEKAAHGGPEPKPEPVPEPVPEPEPVRPGRYLPDGTMLCRSLFPAGFVMRLQGALGDYQLTGDGLSISPRHGRRYRREEMDLLVEEVACVAGIFERYNTYLKQMGLDQPEPEAEDDAVELG